MTKVGFGSKGFAKSTVESTGKKSFAQGFGSPISAFKSFIDFSSDNELWTTLVPSSINTVDISGTKVVHAWRDIINQSVLTQSVDSSKPALDSTNTLRGFPGIRSIADDSLRKPAVDSASTTVQNYCFYSRTNLLSSDTTNAYNIFTTYSTPATPSGYGINIAYNPGKDINYRFLITCFESFPGAGNRSAGVNVQTVANGTPLDFFQKDNIYYVTLVLNGTDKTVKFNLYKKDGTLYLTTTALTSSWAAGGVTSAQYDALFGSPTPVFPKRTLFTNRASTDTTQYTLMRINRSTELTVGEMTTITRYLESAYGAKKL